MVETALKPISVFFLRGRRTLFTCLTVVVLLSALLKGTSLAGDLTVIPDEGLSSAPPLEALHVPQEKAEESGQVRIDLSRAGGSNNEDEKAEELCHRRAAQLKLFEEPVAQEEALMRQAVQILDRQTAARWLASFISSKPLDCALSTQDAWIEAILCAAERNGLPLCKEILGLTAAIVSIESGFHADPVAVDLSRGETVAGLLERAERELHEKYGTVMSVPPVPQVYAAYKKRYYPRLAACRTEGEIEVVAKDVARDLKNDIAKFPAFIQAIVSKEIDKVANVVRTKGSMQLNFLRARQVMTERGEGFTDQELSDYMYTVHGGVDVGVAALKPMFIQYAARYARPGDLSWLFLVGMDYHYGPFSSRNMMEQIRIRDLSGHKITLDGDLIRYDDKGRPQQRESETLQAAASACPSIRKAVILDAFLLEKSPHYIYTDIHAILAEAHRHKFGETPFAAVGNLRMGENAQIKHGTTWKTQYYLRKLDRCLNAIPWD